MVNLREMGKKAKDAAKMAARLSSDQKNQALQAIAEALENNIASIQADNREDLQAGREKGLNDALIDRLSLQDNRLHAIIKDLRQVTALPDPVGETFDRQTLPNGLELYKQRTPLGVLGVIYESRPNVTIDVAALAIKSGNAAILRGGSETLKTNLSLEKALKTGLKQAGLPEGLIQLIPDTDRRLVNELLQLHEFVDMIIPRGGAQLHRFCRENSTIPVITGGIGICHLYVDSTADLQKALPVIFNAKVQRPSACNALDTLLIKREIAEQLIPSVVEALSSAGVAFKGDEEARRINSRLTPADETDWDTEWCQLTLGIKIVSDIEEAIAHIQRHSQGHSDGILTEDRRLAEQFVHEVDSAAVYVNASTRFTDGGQFGLGAEVAISTQKLHARGPMGLQELTSYKWVGWGDYHVRK